MDRYEPDLLETVVPADADARALTTKAKVKAVLGITDTASDALIDDTITRVSDLAVKYCSLAIDSVGTIATFGVEQLRATWLRSDYVRTGELLLPWRPQVFEIDSVTECGVALVAGTDFLLSHGALRRIRDDRPWHWGFDKVVATLTAGLDLPAAVPPGIEARVIDQVKLDFLTRKRDPSLKSENIPDVYEAAYGTVGGAVGDSGLLLTLESALRPYAKRAA